MYSSLIAVIGIGKEVKLFGVFNTTNSIIPISAMYYFGFIKI